MAHHSELGSLISAAVAALVEAMCDGDDAGYDGRWLTQSNEYHRSHANKHITDAYFLDDNTTPELYEEEITHAIFRLTAIKVNLIKQRTGAN